MKKNKTNLVEQAIISEESTKITTNNAEVILDSFLENGALKDIPVIGTLVSTFKIVSGIREGIFYKKLLKFLIELKDITIRKREEMINKMNANEKYSTKVGEKIMIYLDKTEEYDKASIIGKLFKNLINEEIDRETFERLCFMTDKVFLEDLWKLKKIYETRDEEGKFSLKEFDKSNLTSVGLLVDIRTLGGHVKFSSYGKIMVELILNDDARN